MFAYSDAVHAAASKNKHLAKNCAQLKLNKNHNFIIFVHRSFNL